MTVRFTCNCGQVVGALIDPKPSTGDHIVCHCADCQRFVRFLGAQDRVLQAFGGTELFQSRCAKMRLSKGQEKLACVHMTDAPTLRWYTTCCKTPMFNTFAHGKVPYITTFVVNCDPVAAKNAMGPVVGHLFLDKEDVGIATVPVMRFSTLIRRFFVRMVKDFLTGDYRRSALFDPKTLKPIATPYRLPEDERRALR